MDRLRCQCGYVVETPSKFDLLGKACPNCACILLDDLGLGRIVARSCLGLGSKKRTFKVIQEAKPKSIKSVSDTSESLSSEELAELEELNDLMDLNEEYVKKVLFEDGMEQGYNRGVEDGKSVGRAEGELLILQKLIHSGKVTLEEAAAMMNMTVQELGDAIKELE